MSKKLRNILLLLVVLAVSQAVPVFGQSVENHSVTIDVVANVSRYANIRMATGINLIVDKWKDSTGWDEEDVYCEFEANYAFTVGFLLMEYLGGEIPDHAWLYLTTPFGSSTTDNPTYQATGSTGPFSKGITVFPTTGNSLTSVQVGIDGITLADDVGSYGVVGELQITIQPKP